MPTAISSTSTVEFLEEARFRYQFGLNVDKDDRDEAQDDNRFANSSDKDLGQWEEGQRARRIEASRPIFQWNRIPTYVQQVVNDGRENKPSIKIAAADGGQKETAEFFQSRIRHIEYECNADIAFDTARDQQVTTGRGFLRVSTEYVPGTFRQRICIEPIENQFSVVCDPAAKKYDRSDADWWFIISMISQAQHIRDYGKESVVSRADFASWDNPAPDWISVGLNRLIQIAEYWVKEYKARTLCLLPNDIPIWKDEVEPGMVPFLVKGEDGKPLEREDQDVAICQYIINGAEILRPNGGTGPEKTEWIGSTIPIVPVWGRVATVDDKRRTFSLIRQAKDPQRLVNLFVSNIAEQIAQMPKSPYLVPVGGIAANHVEAWKNASNTPLGYLHWIQWDSQNRPLEKPSRIVNEPPIQALSIGLQQAIDAMKASMGIYDASMGARSNETSGIAIQRRQKESDVANFHFPDNEARSRKRVGEICIELIPLLDKPGDRVPVRSEDGKTDVVPIGEEYRDKKGKTVKHVLDDGEYGVTVETGPSYTSARAEANERYAQLVTAQPELMFVIGDKLLRTDNFPGSEEAADRLEKYIAMKTPGLVEDDKDQQEIPQQAQQKIMQLQEQANQLLQVSQDMSEEIKTKKAELDSKEKITALDVDIKKYTVDEQEKTKRMIGLATLDSQEARLELEQSLGIAHKNADRAHEAELRVQDQAHEAGESAADRQHEAEQAEAGRVASQESQEGSQQHAADMADAGHQQALEVQEQAAELAPEPSAE